MLDPRLAIFAAALNLFGTLGYARDTLRGDTQPNRVTWIMWSVAPLIIVAAQFGEEVGWSALLTLGAGLGPAMVVLASFLNKKAYWQITKLDILCGVFSALALILWLITKTGLVAIVLSIAADLLAGLPTILKAYRAPQTESSFAYIAAVIAGVITLLTITNWTFAAYSFPVYMVIFCGILYVLIKFPHWRPARET
jgi:hypothetical protein